jgi:hypothetical protein
LKTKVFRSRKKMKCKLCERKADGNSGLYCGRCDKIANDIILDLKTELEV